MNEIFYVCVSFSFIVIGLCAWAMRHERRAHQDRISTMEKSHAKDWTRLGTELNLFRKALAEANEQILVSAVGRQAHPRQGRSGVDPERWSSRENNGLGAIPLTNEDDA